MASRFLHTAWCDDIRQEVGNKPSLMGLYTGSIVLPQLPFTLPRLSLFNWLWTPIDQPFETEIELRLRRDDGHVLIDMRLNSSGEVEAGRNEVDATGIQVGTAFGIGPVEFPDGMKYLVVEATVDGETIQGPKLRVKVDRQLIDQIMPAGIKDLVDRATLVSPSLLPATHERSG
ncbi:MAG: hypothetical protein REU00_17505 [Pseudomonadota bacterium]|nr:hypothetical protein [Pseudomonadota bacterium]